MQRDEPHLPYDSILAPAHGFDGVGLLLDALLSLPVHEHAVVCQDGRH
jgi:hypothetical protein